jgi:hypothetical protein
VGGVTPEAPIGISDVGTSTKMSYQFIPVGQGFFVNGYDGGAGLTYNLIIINVLL